MTASDFAERRRRLCKRLPPNSVAVVASYGTRLMANDIPYEFRQNANFAYLTGFLEPDSLLVMHRDAERVHATLFVPERDVARELWDGPRTGAGARAVEFLGLDAVENLVDQFKPDSGLASLTSKAAGLNV
jgi:Xaa-Pro aminopeptidase